jgi:tetratricopeptide (TPR) repeat protein
MDLYLALSLVEQETTSREGITKLKDLSTADTFEDVKADAYYHVGKFLMRGTTQKHHAAALGQLRHSIDLYPTEKSLLAGAKCAFALKDTEKARGYLERAVRDFPDGDPETLREADRLLTKVIELKK